MRKPIVVAAGAVDDAVEAREWYDNHAEAVAPRFASELLAAFDAISERPQSFSKLRRSYRVAFLKTFPYYVVFRERESDVEVVAISHARRRPGYWRRRLKD